MLVIIVVKQLILLKCTQYREYGDLFAQRKLLWGTILIAVALGAAGP